MIKIYISNHHNVYTNIAIERYLFQHTQGDIVLFLWQNNPCVVLGRNQNIYNEVNIDYANENKIDLIRRFSGGGAVYQDMGNLNYTFYVKDESLIEKVNKIILDVFKDLDINASFSGRNDLLANNRKFSGIAYCNDFDKVMYHGTCLINSDLNKLSKVLKPHDYKLKSHGVDSYSSRVTNLKDIVDIDSKDIIDSFIINLKRIDEVEVIDEIEFNDDINKIRSLLINKDYIYNDCPSYSYPLDIKLNNANYHFDIEYNKGIITKIDVYSDDLDINKKDFYITNLINKEIPLNNLKDYLSDL